MHTVYSAHPNPAKWKSLIELLDAKQGSFYICKYTEIFVEIQGGLAVQRNVTARKQRVVLMAGGKQVLYSRSA